MNLKELHNPTFRQEDNRLYLVGNTMEKPERSSGGQDSDSMDEFQNERKKWLQSEVKYPVRDEDKIVIKTIVTNIHGNQLIGAYLLTNEIPVPPELMERLVLNKSIVSLCEESCDNSWCKTRGCMNPVNGDDVKIEVTLKEEPKGESEDEYFVIVTTQGNFDIEDDINIPSGRYKLVKVK